MWLWISVLWGCLLFQSAYGADLSGESYLSQATSPKVRERKPSEDRQPSLRLKWEESLKNRDVLPRKVQPAEQEGKPLPSYLKWDGYLKGLVVSSRTPQPENQSYTQALTRLRLRLDAGNDSFRFRAEHDLELSGSNLYGFSSYSQQQATMPPQTRWRGESVLADGNRWQFVQRPYRAALIVRQGPVDAVLGRQRIPLGVGRFYSALDILNPNNPSQVEAEEKIGVDALRTEYLFEPGSRLMAVWAPDPTGRRNNALIRHQLHVNASDVAFTAGNIRSDKLLGGDVATQLGNAGLRGELVLVRPDFGPSYGRGLLGIDYSFVNGLNVSVEGYASGQSKLNHDATLQADPFRRYVEPPGRRYLAGEMRYEPNPILSFSSTVLYNAEDRSGLLGARVQYTSEESIAWTFGIQSFHGAVDSEFGALHFLSYFSTQWYY